MFCSCLFDQSVSDVLQHIAVVFEVTAIVLVCWDFRVYRNDVLRQQRAAGAHTALPVKNRVNRLTAALVIGVIAVSFELYQLATQYWAC